MIARAAARSETTTARALLGSLSSSPSTVLTNSTGTNGYATQTQTSRYNHTNTAFFSTTKTTNTNRLTPGSISSTSNYTTTTHSRSMVTITQTKSTDEPLFLDDVSSSTSAATDADAMTYVMNEDSTLKVTQSCLDQVERLLRQRREKQKDDNHDGHDDGYFLRVFVDAGGCSGFQYQFEVDNELDEDEDVVVAMANINDDDNDSGTFMRPRVVVDETSMGFLEGSTIDYVIEMIKSAFVISDNPQSESACGCGSSFAMKNFDKFGAKD